jgi:hypothetical protein
MICSRVAVAVVCDTDLKGLGLTPAANCWGTTGELDSQGKALDAAKREGFKAHKDGKHHLCKNCAELNPEAVA